MIVCDICRENRASERFSMPLHQGFYTMRDGHVLNTFMKLTKSEVVICPECQKKIATIMDALIRSEE